MARYRDSNTLIIINITSRIKLFVCSVTWGKLFYSSSCLKFLSCYNIRLYQQRNLGISGLVTKGYRYFFSWFVLIMYNNNSIHNTFIFSFSSIVFVLYVFGLMDEKSKSLLQSRKFSFPIFLPTISSLLNNCQDLVKGSSSKSSYECFLFKYYIWFLFRYHF
jgi:hypothetical protein